MAVSELPGNPSAVWTVKKNSSGNLESCVIILLLKSLCCVLLLTEEFDTYIAVSFTNATLVLSIGETVEEVTDSGFLGTTPTLACSRLGEDALIQVIMSSTVQSPCVYTQ